MKASLALASILPLLAAAGPVEPANVRTVLAPSDSPPNGQVKIRAVTYGGTGCPQGTVGTIISQDASTVTLIFDAYSAQTGPKFQPAETRKNCQLNFALTYPGGFQYSVLSADYRGYADIDRGVTGTLKSTYYFSGSSTQTSTEANFVGPIEGDYVKHDEIENSSTVWSPCGAEGMLNINSQVRLQASDSKASGLLTTDSIDAKFVQKLGGGSSNSPAPAPPAGVPAPPNAPKPPASSPKPPASSPKPPASSPKPPTNTPKPPPEDEEDDGPSPSGPIQIPSVTTTPRPGSGGNNNNNNNNGRPGNNNNNNNNNNGRPGNNNNGRPGNNGNGGFGNSGGFGGFGNGFPSSTTGQSDSFQLNNPSAPSSRPSNPPASWNSGSTSITWSG